MSAKHTPGPWVVRESSCGSVGTASMLIAMAYGDDPDCKADDRMAANARLIAAAPELLGALKAICDEQDANEGYATPATYDAARAVIAKAEAQQ